MTDHAQPDDLKLTTPPAPDLEQKIAEQLAKYCINRAIGKTPKDIYRRMLKGLREAVGNHITLNETLLAKFATQQEEIERIIELLWGSRCTYCGEVIGADKKNQDIADDELKRHIRKCTKHPYGEMRAKHDILFEKNARLTRELEAAADSLREYGKHLNICLWPRTGKCDCGFHEVREALKQPDHQPADDMGEPLDGCTTAQCAKCKETMSTERLAKYWAEGEWETVCEDCNRALNPLPGDHQPAGDGGGKKRETKIESLGVQFESDLDEIQ